MVHLWLNAASLSHQHMPQNSEYLAECTHSTNQINSRSTMNTSLTSETPHAHTHNNINFTFRTVHTAVSLWTAPVSTSHKLSKLHTKLRQYKSTVTDICDDTGRWQVCYNWPIVNSARRNVIGHRLTDRLTAVKHTKAHTDVPQAAQTGLSTFTTIRSR